MNINLTPTTEVAVRFNGNFDDYNGPLNGGEEIYKQAMQNKPSVIPKILYS